MTTTLRADRFDRGRPDHDEAAFLAAGVGAVLRSRRHERGLTQHQLATLAGCAERTIRFLEHGGRRPRGSLLDVLAGVLAPECPRELAGALRSAAGASLADETAHSLRRRVRSAREAQRRRQAAYQAVRRQQEHVARQRERDMQRFARRLRRMTPTQMREALAALDL